MVDLNLRDECTLLVSQQQKYYNLLKAWLAKRGITLQDAARCVDVLRAYDMQNIVDDKVFYSFQRVADYIYNPKEVFTERYRNCLREVLKTLWFAGCVSHDYSLSVGLPKGWDNFSIVAINTGLPERFCAAFDILRDIIISTKDKGVMEACAITEMVLAFDLSSTLLLSLEIDGVKLGSPLKGTVTEVDFPWAGVKLYTDIPCFCLEWYLKSQCCQGNYVFSYAKEQGDDISWAVNILNRLGYRDVTPGSLHDLRQSCLFGLPKNRALQALRGEVYMTRAEWNDLCTEMPESLLGLYPHVVDEQVRRGKGVHW